MPARTQPLLERETLEKFYFRQGLSIQQVADRGYYQSTKAGRIFYMSSWEHLRFQELDGDPSVLMYKPQPCSVPYRWEGVTKIYTPDILVIYEGRLPELEEIKPRRVIDNDKSGRIAAKLNAGRQFAAQQGWPFRVIDRKPEGQV